MAIACDPNSLMAGADCIECNIPPGAQLPVLISLFCQMAGTSCDPNTLMGLAAPLQGIPYGAQLSILIALACQIVNNGGGGGGGNTQLVTYTVGTPPNPPNTALPALAYDPTGNLPTMGWNTITLTWN